MIQMFGAAAFMSGLLLAWSPWALVIAGALMLVVPEVWEAVKR